MLVFVCFPPWESLQDFAGKGITVYRCIRKKARNLSCGRSTTFYIQIVQKTKHDMSFINELQFLFSDKLLQYKRNKTLPDFM